MWTPNDNLILRRFLSEETGRKLLHELRLSQPEIAGNTIEETALTAREFKGYALCLEELESLASQAPEQKSANPKWIE